MAPASAAKTSRPRASRSGTTTASSAKAAAKDDAKDGTEWSARDQEDARAQGWELVECIDEKTRKIFFEVMYCAGSRFTADGAARAFVMNQNKAGDELAIRAMRVVFRSKVGETGRKKK